MPPTAIRTRPLGSSSAIPLTTAGKEHLDEAVLCIEAFEREDPLHESDVKLSPLTTLTVPTARGALASSSPARRLRLPAVLGISHSSGSQMSAMDRAPPNQTLALFGK